MQGESFLCAKLQNRGSIEPAVLSYTSESFLPIFNQLCSTLFKDSAVVHYVILGQNTQHKFLTMEHSIPPQISKQSWEYEAFRNK